MMAGPAGKLRVALCQLAVTASKAANIAAAAELIGRAKAEHRADLVVLPECFNCPYGTQYFAEYAEPVPELGTDVSADSVDMSAAGETVRAAAAAAKGHKVWLLAGSIPERCLTTGNIYNTSLSFCPEGVLRARHRKVHLFKLDTPQVKFDESLVLTAGDSLTTFTVGGVPRSQLATPATEGAEADDDATEERQGAAATTDAMADVPRMDVGVGICFDIRFPMMAAAYQSRGTGLLAYPGAFNMVTGPAHWQLAARARAVDAQQYVCVVSPARDESAGYVAYGHSMLVSPWGQVLCEAGEGQEIVSGEVDPTVISDVRQKLPTMAGRRGDLYDTEVAWRSSA